MSLGSEREVDLAPCSRFSPLLQKLFLTATFRKCKAFSTSSRTVLEMNSSSHQSQHSLSPFYQPLFFLLSGTVSFPRFLSVQDRSQGCSLHPPHLPGTNPRICSVCGCHVSRMLNILCCLDAFQGSD